MRYKIDDAEREHRARDREFIRLLAVELLARKDGIAPAPARARVTPVQPQPAVMVAKAEPGRLSPQEIKRRAYAVMANGGSLADAARVCRMRVGDVNIALNSLLGSGR